MGSEFIIICYCVKQGKSTIASSGCTAYVNTTCQHVLRQTSSCLVPGVEQNGNHVIIAANVDQDRTELAVQHIKYIFNALGASQACASSVMAFMCQYLFPLCDGNGTVHKPSRDRCIEISNGVCRDEWKSAINILNLKDYLPDCQDLPEKSLCNNGNMQQYIGLLMHVALTRSVVAGILEQTNSADSTQEIQTINASKIQYYDHVVQQ